MSPRVLIVGGGLAGLAAAAALAQRRIPVTLLESRPRLGGRAGSFLDHESGEWIDTCQHVAMGCCTNLLHFCRSVGIDDLFQEERELTFIGPSGQRCPFFDHPGPAPLHLARALLGLRYLSWTEKAKLALDLRELSRIHWAKAEDLSFHDWLHTHSRTAHMGNRFWDVILISALSETAERISVATARKVFVDGFLANRTAWRVHLPTVPLDELYGRRVTDWLQSRGATVRTQAGVARLEEHEGRVTAARLRSGETVDSDEFILAVPWHRIADVVPESLARHPVIVDATRLEAAPITSVHLWFDRPVIDVPHAVLIGRLSQWVFARPDVGREQSNSRPSSPDSRGAYLQVVISASCAAVMKTQAEVTAEVVQELAELWPRVNAATLVHSRVVTDHRAVFSPLPKSESQRPDQQSPIGNLQLAGDWTRTGWPATMEGAVRSGYLAAENVLRRLGREESLVQPGLPVSGAARWLLGLRANATD